LEDGEEEGGGWGGSGVADADGREHGAGGEEAGYAACKSLEGVLRGMFVRECLCWIVGESGGLAYIWYLRMFD
jgi:hypothetical protein